MAEKAKMAARQLTTGAHPEKLQNSRLRLVLEYDGTNFSGWQIQKDARTVQGDLLKVARKIFADRVVDLQGCGRTDGGVHALAYSAHIELKGAEGKGAQRPENHLVDRDDLLHRFNDLLPKDIALTDIVPVDDRFHARHSCKARAYMYQLDRRKSAFGKRYSWWVRERLDVDYMRQLAVKMEGMHDFRSFADKRELKKSTRVLVYGIDIQDTADQLAIRVVGSHFLWHMVRRMVGLLVAGGCGTLNKDVLAQLPALPGSEIAVGHTAPAAGLFFEQAFYEETELQQFLSGFSAASSEGR